MRRRDFLIQAGASGLIAPVLARAANPCPPPEVSIVSGQSASTACSASGATANSDWLARVNAPGVVWAHNFASAAEVNKFRFDSTGVDPLGTGDPNGSCAWDGTDGFAGGGCCKVTIPTGGVSVAEWMRPFQALPGDIGYTSGPDWVGQSTYMAGNWGIGFYGNAAYHDGSTNNGWPVWAGTDFYIQFRVKISASRFTAGNPDGKLVFLGVTNLTPDQELVIRSLQSSLFDLYTNFGDRNNSYLTGNQQTQSGSSQPGGSYDATCQGSAKGPTTCYCYPADQWVTVLIHVIPGLRCNVVGSDNVDYSTPGGGSTGIQVWVAAEGQTSYTKIWDKQDYFWAYDPMPNGWNMVGPTGYMNNANAVAGWTQKFTQVIFSTQSIACPQV